MNTDKLESLGSTLLDLVPTCVLDALCEVPMSRVDVSSSVLHCVPTEVKPKFKSI